MPFQPLYVSKEVVVTTWGVRLNVTAYNKYTGVTLRAQSRDALGVQVSIGVDAEAARQLRDDLTAALDAIEATT